MRFGLGVLLLATVAGCPPQDSGGSGGGDDGWYEPPGDSDPGYGRCEQDGDCNGDTCARDGECLPASEVRHIQVTWTVSGATASVDTCASHADLYIQFSGVSDGDGVGFAPVPCREGVFTVDKMPTRFIRVSLGTSTGGDYASGDFDDTGHVTLDIP